MFGHKRLILQLFTQPKLTLTSEASDRHTEIMDPKCNQLFPSDGKCKHNPKMHGDRYTGLEQIPVLHHSLTYE